MSLTLRCCWRGDFKTRRQTVNLPAGGFEDLLHKGLLSIQCLFREVTRHRWLVDCTATRTRPLWAHNPDAKPDAKPAPTAEG